MKTEQQIVGYEYFARDPLRILEFVDEENTVVITRIPGRKKSVVIVDFDAFSLLVQNERCHR